MTKEEAAKRGYAVVEASAIEWGLLRDGKGIRTWWKSTFPNKPELDDPKVMEAIRFTEDSFGFQ